MKFSQQFADSVKPKDIDKAALEAYLSQEVYAVLALDTSQKTFDWARVKALMAYLSQGLYNPLESLLALFTSQKTFDWARFKAETDVAIDKVKTLSGLDKFEELRGKFAAEIQSGSTLNDAKLIKSLLEVICYKLEKKGESLNLQLFADEVKSSTFEECLAGAAANVQKILYAMQSSDYYQKYDYIQNLATEYTQENGLAEGYREVHQVNELMHEVSALYNVIPPHDTHSRYRDLSDLPEGDFVQNSKFVEYLASHLSSKQGVHAFISFCTKDAMSRLPQESELKTEDVAQQGAAMQRLNVVLEGMNIPLLTILKEDENGDYVYKADCEAIMEAHVMQKLLTSGVIEQDILQVQGKNVIEAPGGWFLFDPTKWDIGEAYRKLLDTKQLQGLTVEGKNIEDFLHERLQEPLTNGISFDTALRGVVAEKSQELSVTTDELNIKLGLFLVSDQTSDLRKIFPTKIIVSMSIPALKETSNFFKNLKKDGIDILEDINSKDRHGNTALIWAATKGYSQTAEMLIAIGADVDARDNNGNTALICSAFRGNVKIVEMLIEARAHVNAQDKDGKTALMWAAEWERTEIAVKLIDAGAHVNARDNNGNTALILSAELGRKEIAEMLIEARAHVNAWDNNGNTALILSAELGCKEIVEMLIKARAHVNARDYNGNTALMWAAHLGRKEIVTLLIDNDASVDAKDNNDKTTLMHAASASGNTEIVAMLITRGAPVDDLDNNRNTALIWAALKGSADTVEMLITKGADINVRNKDGKTALISSIVNGQKEIAEMLIIAGGASVDATDEDGKTALMYAAEEGCKEIATLLIDNDADINVRNKYGQTALMSSIVNRQKEIAEMLIIAGGASADATDKYGKTALMYAASASGNTEIVAMLITRGAPVDDLDNNRNTALIWASLKGNADTVEMLITKGADINVRNKDGKTALISSIVNGQKEIAEMLIIAGGASVDATDEDGKTTLMHAATRGLTEIVTLLIDNAAAVDATDKYGKTALMYAALERNGEDAVAMLITKGADVNARDNNGNTALMLMDAARLGSSGAAKMLVELEIARQEQEYLALFFAWFRAAGALKYLLTEYIPLAHYVQDFSAVKYMAKYENDLLSAAHVVTIAINIKHVVGNLGHYKLNPMKLLNLVSNYVAFLARPYIYQYRDELLLLSKDSQYEKKIKHLAFMATDAGLSLVLQGPNMPALVNGLTIGAMNSYYSEHPDSEQLLSLSSTVAFITTTLALYSCYKHTQRDALALPLVCIPPAAFIHLYTKYLVDANVEACKLSPSLSETTNENLVDANVEGWKLSPSLSEITNENLVDANVEGWKLSSSLSETTNENLVDGNVEGWKLSSSLSETTNENLVDANVEGWKLSPSLSEITNENLVDANVEGWKLSSSLSETTNENLETDTELSPSLSEITNENLETDTELSGYGGSW